MRRMTWQTEFPDFPPSGMPALAFPWVDTSWRNDTCPSYALPLFADGEQGPMLFIEYPDPAEREIPETLRFGFQLDTSDWENTSADTDDETAMRRLMAVAEHNHALALLALEA